MTPNAPALRRYRGWSLAICALAIAASLLLHAHGIRALRYPDMDDRLRLLEVRDWLAGQAFTDVSQYRMSAPSGAPMHWSRLVDMPIAGLELVLRPVIGVARAELAAAILVPMLTLALMLLGVGAIARRLGGDRAGLAATALTATAIATTVQAQPLRVDHHGWEIVLSVGAMSALLGRHPLRGGILAGLCIALAMQISLEALPFAAAIGAVLGLGWALDGRTADRARLLGYALALAGCEAPLFALLHSPAQWVGACDAVSPAQLLGLAVAAMGVALVTTLNPRYAGGRIAGLAMAAGLAGAALHAVRPHCGADAFPMLEPIVRTFWYDQVSEGQPLWRQLPLVVAATIAFPLIALGATLVLTRQSSGAERRRWVAYLLLLAAATGVAAMVQRAGGLANALAVPGATIAMLRLVAVAQASGRASVRVGGTVAAVLALSPPFAPLLAGLRSQPAVPAAKMAREGDCSDTAAIRQLATLPTGRFLAPFDIGPAILLDTQHAVLASGHHRNHAAMAEELRAWLGDAATARAVLGRHGLGYVLTCQLPEMTLYRNTAPRGFAAQLANGRAPAWLTPVSIRGAPFQVWRVTR